MTSSPSSSDERRLLWVLALATGLPLTALGAPQVALPGIASALEASFDDQQWVLAIYALGLAALQFASGPIADRLGRRRTTLVGLLVFAGASLVATVAPSVAVLVVARGVQGVGGALTITGALALLAAATPAENRLRAVALRSSVIAGSFAVGPLIGGLIVDGVGWRAVFAVNLVVALPLAWRLRRPVAEPPPALAAQADWWGLAVLTGGLVCGLGAIIRGNDVGWTSAPIVALAVAAVAGLVVFGVRDARGPAPLLPGRLVRNRVFVATTLGLAGLYFAIFGGLVYVTRFLLEVRGTSPTETGLILAPFAVVSLLCVLVATSPRQRWSQRGLVSVAFLCGAAGLWSLSGLDGATSAWALQPALVLLGIASGIVNPTFTAGHLAAFSARDGGIAAGVNSSARQLGTALGTAVLGALVQHGMATRLRAEGLSPSEIAAAVDGRASVAAAQDALASEVGAALLVGALVLLALAVLALVSLSDRPLAAAVPARP